MKRILTALICLLPSKLAIFFLKLLGHKVSYNSKIGFSLILVNSLTLKKNSRIGHFNFIKIKEIVFDERAYIGRANIIKGPFSLHFDKQGAIGNSNKVVRAGAGVTYGKSILKMGELAKITAGHYIDLTNSITFGDFSTLAGANSQVWTHGYIHAKKGPHRVRVDGVVTIGDNVYIGSQCIVNAGIKIKNAITVGSNSTISKDLVESGMYVGQKLRYLDKHIEDVENNLEKVNVEGLTEIVYKK